MRAGRHPETSPRRRARPRRVRLFAGRGGASGGFRGGIGWEPISPEPPPPSAGERLESIFAALEAGRAIPTSRRRSAARRENARRARRPERDRGRARSERRRRRGRGRFGRHRASTRRDRGRVFQAGGVANKKRVTERRRRERTYRRADASRDGDAGRGGGAGGGGGARGRVRRQGPLASRGAHGRRGGGGGRARRLRTGAGDAAAAAAAVRAFRDVIAYVAIVSNHISRVGSIVGSGLETARSSPCLRGSGALAGGLTKTPPVPYAPLAIVVARSWPYTAAFRAATAAAAAAYAALSSAGAAAAAARRRRRAAAADALRCRPEPQPRQGRPLARALLAEDEPAVAAVVPPVEERERRTAPEARRERAASSAHGARNSRAGGSETEAAAGAAVSGPGTNGAPAGRAAEYMDAVGVTVRGRSSVRFRLGAGSSNSTRTPYPHRTSAPAVVAGHPGASGTRGSARRSAPRRTRGGTSAPARSF